MCRITELVSDVLINLYHLRGFGSNQQLVLFNLEWIFSAVCFLSILSTAFSMLMRFCSTLAAKPGIRVIMLYLVKVVLLILIPLTSLNNQLQQNQLTRALIFLSKAPAQGGSWAFPPGQMGVVRRSRNPGSGPLTMGFMLTAASAATKPCLHFTMYLRAAQRRMS